MKPYILVVDDEPDIRGSVKDILEDEGYSVGLADSGESARKQLRQKSPDLILLDIWMPNVDGITLLKEITNDMHISAPVIMMSGHGTVETAVEATRLGARDFIEKPLSLAKLLHTVEQVLQEPKNRQHDAQEQLVTAPVGKSPQMQLLRDQLERLAELQTPVLFQGEPGSGKSYCARYLHAHGNFHSGSFVKVNTRLFLDGEARALFLGDAEAQDHGQGFLERAQGGTLYLDDVAELDMEMQQSLYSVLSSRQWVRLNGGSSFKLDARIITATRYNLQQEVRAGRFREDLYHLLKVVPVKVPALREHVEDVSELLQYYVNLMVDNEGLPYRNFTVAVQNRLRHYEWPGNIRELQSLVRRVLTFGLESDIGLEEVETILEDAGHFSMTAMLPEFDLPLRQAREQFEKAYLEFHMRQAGGSVGKVAKQVGMERTHLYRKLRSLGIDARRTVRENK